MSIVTLINYCIAVIAMMVLDRPVMRHMLVIGFVWTLVCVVTGWHWFFLGHGFAIGYGLVKVSNK